MVETGVSLDPNVRANDPAQRAALEKFVDLPDVAAAAAPRIERTKRLLTDYALQHALTGGSTGLVDSGGTGRMVGSLITVIEAAGQTRPHIYFWGHEPRPDGWTDPKRVHAWMYNTATGDGLDRRVPDAPFLVETFCMGDHGIVSGYEEHPDGQVTATFRSERNRDAEMWGIETYRSTVLAFTQYLDLSSATGDARPIVADLMREFWVSPTRDEAAAWGSYLYDSDPTGTAARTFAKRFTTADLPLRFRRRRVQRGDRAWVRGSFALSHWPLRTIVERFFDDDELLGAPPDRPHLRSIDDSDTTSGTRRPPCD